MAFRGLFIGIDRYAAAEINWLSCASRDGTALHALFTDTFGDQTALLTDEQATVAAIQQHIGQLDTVSPDDIVVIAFSGHGTETHELVGYDTDPDDLVGTAISLAALGPVQRNCDVLRLVSRRGCRSYSRLRTNWRSSTTSMCGSGERARKGEEQDDLSLIIPYSTRP